MANIPYVAVKSMDVQLQKLVTEPCMQLNTSPLITVLIDGLDECNEPGVQQEVLRCIGHSIRAQDSCPIQFLIASRPESHLREVFQGSLFHEIHNSFNVDQSFEDVRMLKDEFARIHREHHQTMAGVSRPWPSPDVIKYLVDESSGYFIYAATVIKFVMTETSGQQSNSRLSWMPHIWNHLLAPWTNCTCKFFQLYQPVIVFFRSCGPWNF
ncbi:hypothetical protein C8J57DRAFT_1672813 [Mycena rebaudengoi]|nr:hypothetical protein C8J57DRAFT_1672813 [Mycena rebaudengoi]